MPPTSLDFVPPTNFRWLGLPQQPRYSWSQFSMFASFVSTVINIPDGYGPGKKTPVSSYSFKEISACNGREGRQNFLEETRESGCS